GGPRRKGQARRRGLPRDRGGPPVRQRPFRASDAESVPSVCEGTPRRRYPMIPGRGRRARGAANALVTAALWLVATSPAGAQGSNVYQTTLGEAKQKTSEVSTDELKRILDDGSAVVLDTRPRREYAMSPIPGARNVAPKADVPMSMYVSDVAEV